MIDFQAIKTASKYDVCIIGSGAGGAMAAYVLAASGVKVCLLEAGPDYDVRKNTTLLKFPHESPRRGAITPRSPYGDFGIPHGGWTLEGEPYTTTSNTQFDWFRSRMVGGRTNQWGRIALRFGPNDFKQKSKDGMGEDWPIAYEDVRPYYDKIDRLIGIFGSNEGLFNDPDGIFLPPPKPRLHELLVKQDASSLGIRVIPSRLSILTKRIDNERQVCFYCGQCNRGCNILADFSASVLIKPAIHTGNLELVTDAMAREILTNEKGEASGVSYIDTISLKENQIKARIVVLAASAAESARLLLNSKSSFHPEGLTNSSGLVGRYLHDSTGVTVGGILPKLFNRTRYNEDGVGGMHIYSPWWLDNRNLNFPRGYHIEYWGGMTMPSYGFGASIQTINGKYPGLQGKIKRPGGFGSSLKEDYRFYYGAEFGMAGRGEAIARKENYCEVDPSVVDKYGIPVLRFHYEWSDYEIKQAKHMQETFEEIMHKMGADMIWGKAGKDENYGLENPGRMIHEVGTTRMGDDRRQSVVTKFNQAHDCKNLFIVDGGPFVSQPDKNPTWTILALSMRASEYIIDEMKKQNI